MLETKVVTMKMQIEKLILTLILLAAAGLAPNLFPAAQAGYAKFSALALYLLFPSLVVIGVVLFWSGLRGHKDLRRQALVGLAAGLAGTVGLEIVRHTGFLLGGMPGELPKLMGVLLLDRFALGPNALSNLAGWGYHFWNGAAFGLIYTLLLGRGRVWQGVAFGFLVGIGFMASPAALALGVGLFGADFGIGFPITVSLAHIAFGAILGFVVYRKNPSAQSLLARLRSLVPVQNQ
ncbi:MAG: hypothetical protein Kow0042_26720 [Calditrichia bacterium]